MKMSSAWLMLLMVPLAVSAQTNANSFRQLKSRQLLTEGDTIVITYTQDAGEEHAVARGTFVGLTNSAVEVRLDSGEKIEIAERDVSRIKRERKDSVWKGAFVGGGVGLGYGAFSSILICGSAWECEAGPTAGYILAMSGIGFAVGALIDSAVGKSNMEAVYLEPQPDTRSMSLSVSPLLARGQNGVRFTVTW